MNTQTQEELEKNNVVHINAKLSKNRITSIEESINFLKESKREYCDESLDFIIDHIYNIFSSLGFMHDNRRVNAKELVLLENLIQSILYRYHGIEHPFSELADEIIVVDDEQGE